MNGEYVRISKETATTYLKLIFRHLPGENEENNENLSRDNRKSGPDSASSTGLADEIEVFQC
jgi:hypothetical protein